MSAGRGPVVEVCRTTELLSRTPEAEGWLTAVERERAAAFRFAADRDDFVAAHVLVRICAGRLLDVRPERVTLIQRCGTCDGPHGRPVVPESPDAHLTLAHTHGHVAAAAATCPIGVDVERLDRRAMDPGVVEFATSAAERRLIASASDPHDAFLAIWVLKESLVKAGVLTLGRFADADLAECFTVAGALEPGATWRGFELTIWQSDGALFGQAVATSADATAGAWRAR